MSLKSLQDLYIEELKDIYSAEKQIIQALPKMAKAASNEELQLAFKNHLEVTKDQVTRLESIFGDLERKPQGKKCQGMAGLVEEGKEMMEEEGDPDVKDAALIASAQRIEHYEISAYGRCAPSPGSWASINTSSCCRRRLTRKARRTSCSPAWRRRASIAALSRSAHVGAAPRCGFIVGPRRRRDGGR